MYIYIETSFRGIETSLLISLNMPLRSCFFEASLSSTCDRVFTKQTIENEANRIEFEFLFPAILETKRDHFDQFSTAGEEKLKTVDVFAGGGEENRGD